MTMVTRSRSMRASVSPGSNRSSSTKAAPTWMAATRVNDMPPTQNRGMGV